MKKTIFLFVAIVIALSSCKKMMHKKHDKHDHEEIKETINVEGALRAGETYTYTLPTNQSDDPYEITLQATKYVTSALSTDAAGNMIYTYTAPLTALPVTSPYTQDITIANVEEAHTGGCQGGGNMGEHHGKENDQVEIERTINIHLTINGTSNENMK